MQFQPLLRNFVIFALFITAMLALFITTQAENNIPNPIVDNAVINSTYTNLQSNFGSYENSSDTVYSQYSAEKPAPGFFTIVLLSIVSVGKTFGTYIFGIFNVIVVVPAVFLGISPVFFSAIIIILTLTVVVGLWAIYKYGG